jgi:hypothetical protein
MYKNREFTISPIIQVNNADIENIRFQYCIVGCFGHYLHRRTESTGNKVHLVQPVHGSGEIEYSPDRD